MLLSLAVVWGLYSLVIFSTHTIHRLHNTQAVELGFPGVIEDWWLRGSEENFEVCGQSLCLKSAVPEHTSLVLDAPVDVAQLEAADDFILEMLVSPWNGAKYVDMDLGPTVFYITPMDENERRFRTLLPMVFFQEGQQSRWYREVTAIRDGTHKLRLAFVVDSTGAWKIDDLRVYTVKYSRLYSVLRWVAHGGWALIFVYLVLQLQVTGGALIKIVRTTVFSLILFVGIGQAAPLLLTSLAHYASLWWGDSAFPVEWISGGANNNFLHPLLHFFITLVLRVNSENLKLTWPRIIAINMILAIGIECVQMGIPGRSAEIEDVLLATSGVVLAFFMFQFLRLVNPSKTSGGD